jgi:hypothetical protein
MLLAVFILMCSYSITEISESTHSPVSGFYLILLIWPGVDSDISVIE